MANRVRRLEQVRVSPWLRPLQPNEEFEAEVMAGIAERRYDRHDMPLVLAAVKRWLQDGTR